MDVKEWTDGAIAFLMGYLPNFIGAIIYLAIGLLFIKFFRRIIKKLMNKENADPTLLKFIMDVCTWIFRVLLFVSVIGKLGVETSAFVAAIGAAGLAIGLSLQGSLSNFAGGLLIIVFKPFRVGDFIEAQGQGGTVNSIQIFSTKLITPNNQVVYMPNGTLSNNTIKNYSQEPIRKSEIIIGVGYKSNLKHVRDVLQGIIESDPKILKEPAPVVRVKDLADNSVNFVIFAWATNEDYWQMLSDFLENTKNVFDAEGIEIPFPQRDIIVKHIDENNKPI